ncbi:MAG: hypothetical protein QGF46_01840, partial [Planctomycetota bacterium]|nr:hypothetical protein [Planctomycetota bacterium]
MTLQRIIDAEPSIVGSMTESERAEIRRRWYKKLGGLGWEELYKEWLENPPPPLESLRPSLESRR